MIFTTKQYKHIARIIHITHHEQREDGLADEVIDQKEGHTGEDTGKLGEDLVTRTHPANSVKIRYFIENIKLEVNRIDYEDSQETAELFSKS